MTKVQEIRENQSNFLRTCSSPRPLEFFKRFKFRSKSSGYSNYKLGLEKALKDEPNSENLLEMERKYNNDEFKDEWTLYDDWKKNKKVNDKVRKRKREAHATFHAQLDNDLIGRKETDGNPISNNENEEPGKATSSVEPDIINPVNNNIDKEGEEDDSKILVHDILDDIVSASQAEKDILDIYRSNFSQCLVMDLRLNSELSLSLNQELQDKILHEVFDPIDNKYIPDEIHKYLSDFFNADHGKQGWCEAIRSIVIYENDSGLLKDIKELLKETLGRFVKAFSLDALNPLRDVTVLERPHLNQFVHPLIDSVLGEITLQGKSRAMADGAGFLNDVSNYQIVCMEGAKPGARKKKIVDDDEKNIRNMMQLFDHVIISEAMERRQIYTDLRIYGATAYRTELSLSMLDFHGTYRLFEIDRFSLPKDWVDMPNFVFMYEALMKWAMCIRYTRENLIAQRKKRRMGRYSEARIVKKLA
ncbi:14656_t:CDS:2, partial [Funneliformis geosporum]